MKIREFLPLFIITLFFWCFGTVQSATPKDVLVVGQIAEPKSLDPATITAVNDFRIVMNIYDGLTRYKDGSLEVEPALAKSWDISKDGTVYTFHLRENITFHDGTPFNASAVKFNFDRMLNKKHPYHDVTGPFPLSFFFSSVEKVTVVDEYTVRFQLKEPYAPFLSNLAYPTGLIVSPEAVKKYGEDFGRNPVGTGAYKFVEWESNQRVVVEKNQDYWDGVPKLKAVIFRPITNSNTRVTEMLSGGLDIMVETPPDSLQIFRKKSGFTVYEQAGPHLWFLILNMKEGPFTDIRMRHAVNYAINKKAIVENILKGTATVANSPTPAAFAWAHNDNLEPYPYNPQKAKKLIKEAGYKGAELTFYITEGGSGMLAPKAMGTAIQADLAKIGLDVKIQTFEWNTFLSKVNDGLEGKADMAEMAWMTNDPDTLPYLALRTDAWPDKGGFNSGYYSNPEVDKLLEKARRSTNQQKRAEYYKKMQKIVYEDAPWAFIANWKQNAVSRANVKNFKLQPSFFLLLHDVEKQ
ncbi:MAG: ABC transporter substrate-binding protein [Flexistipes sinusarabici]|uniref:ABC transporter substrate-binding protein n=1 Tax=Flexistipes sinusarabici TaxID=2352 RepID=A0A5D0MW16_FLESI|nr:ABC transporter substrate-binding protein [Flexistipes sinusarabici]TYB36221.1 MAG: ABC transporter substrate-binding protein [Flexistipes sinusarabici]